MIDKTLINKRKSFLSNIRYLEKIQKSPHIRYLEVFTIKQVLTLARFLTWAKTMPSQQNQLLSKYVILLTFSKYAETRSIHFSDFQKAIFRFGNF